MEDRKLEEIEYYDREADNFSGSKKEAGSLASFDPFLLESYQFLKNFLKSLNTIFSNFIIVISPFY